MNQNETPLLAAPLRGVVQHYAWGGFDYIPRLLNIENNEHKPFAELWFGAHASAPSIAAVASQNIPLDALINSHPAVLGQKVRQKFGRLPYLLKVLDARDMLSIQVHPSKQQAEEGFTRENKLGVPLDAPHRNYKDNNHKPEVHVALTDFWMLHGFRPTEEIAHLLATIPEFSSLGAGFRNKGIEGLYKKIMSAPQVEIDALLDPLIQRLADEKPRDMDTPDFWALKAATTFPLPGGHLDRGIFSIYLFNLLHLKPGEGTFQGAGVLHAYLHGTNVELMANSDNVLRGGLTPKHVDVPELLKTVRFQGKRPDVLRATPKSEFEQCYQTPAPDFQLSRLHIPADQSLSLKADGPEILLFMGGHATATSGPVFQHLSKGKAVFVPAKTTVTLATAEDSILFRAAVPE